METKSWPLSWAYLENYSWQWYLSVFPTWHRLRMYLTLLSRAKLCCCVQNRDQNDPSVVSSSHNPERLTLPQTVTSLPASRTPSSTLFFKTFPSHQKRKKKVLSYNGYINAALILVSWQAQRCKRHLTWQANPNCSEKTLLDWERDNSHRTCWANSRPLWVGISIITEHQ